MIDGLFTLSRAAKGWRTMLLSVALAVVGVLQTADCATIVGPGQVGPTMLIIAVVVAVLRALTDTAVGNQRGQ